MTLAPRCYRGFLHRFKQSGLRLGRRPVDLISQQDIGKYRAWTKMEKPFPTLRIGLDHLGTGNIRRHQVRGELDATKFQFQGLGKRADHQCLGQAGNTHQQTMATGEQGQEQLPEHLLLADDLP